MRLSETISKIRTLNVPVFDGRDVAGVLRISPNYVSKILHRLQNDKIIQKISGNKWAWAEESDKFVIGSFITYPAQSYISLQSALFHHGMISQIPVTTYCVSLGRAQRVKTSMGDFSIHHIQPAFFFGFEEIGSLGARMATPEKALLDILYLSPTKTRLFKKLPELEFPKKFSKKICRDMISKIKSPQRKTLVEDTFEDLLKNAPTFLPRRFKQTTF
jgi:predicted transcriptional regulator of viral defense system